MRYTEEKDEDVKKEVGMERKKEDVGIQGGQAENQESVPGMRHTLGDGRKCDCEKEVQEDV